VDRFDGRRCSLRQPLHKVIAITLRLNRLPFIACALLMCVAVAASAASEVVVPIDLAQVAARGEGDVPPRAQVQVSDLRQAAGMERTTIGGVSLGLIRLEPGASELVQAVVAARAGQVLARRGIADAPPVACGLREFEIATPATILYWDVQARIELVLRVHGQDRAVAATASERTFVWPSAEIIARVTSAALRKLGAESERALEALMADAPR
jgi:hypothetical protein